MSWSLGLRVGGFGLFPAKSPSGTRQNSPRKPADPRLRSFQLRSVNVAPHNASGLATLGSKVRKLYLHWAIWIPIEFRV